MTTTDVPPLQVARRYRRADGLTMNRSSDEQNESAVMVWSPRSHRLGQPSKQRWMRQRAPWRNGHWPSRS
jgi:hypothetical protein